LANRAISLEREATEITEDTERQPFGFATEQFAIRSGKVEFPVFFPMRTALRRGNVAQVLALFQQEYLATRNLEEWLIERPFYGNKLFNRTLSSREQKSVKNRFWTEKWKERVSSTTMLATRTTDF
jgi:hypothetical protein